VHVGLVGNLNYFEIVDLMLGFFGVDLCGDDGVLLGHWPWQSKEEADAAAFDFQEIRDQFIDQSGRTSGGSGWTR